MSGSPTKRLFGLAESCPVQRVRFHMYIGCPAGMGDRLSLIFGHALMASMLRRLSQALGISGGRVVVSSGFFFHHPGIPVHLLA